jgi:hypothetical protein
MIKLYAGPMPPTPRERAWRAGDFAFRSILVAIAVLGIVAIAHETADRAASVIGSVFL